ncbi:metacaspase type I [Volvox carteri f. nagariensis]|uniref:Metacaspase type I n=1 Tax=Volvox carteri f. nagariensis TaxID=3068 RepID=D8TNV9_VOLCA|nr:metacaspase type I [Volvox carteri f. nagariensis]EFJ51059.1 metacaspase type I [Volvox carteri f. nagariensis]|eukprot:XP_002948071.1 metacaspase type I [Volvox carteri f. nagariensis]
MPAYGTPTTPYGAAPAPYGAPPALPVAAQSSSPASAPANAPPPGGSQQHPEPPRVSAVGPQDQQQQQAASQAPGQGGSSSQQRPSSAYPTVGATSNPGPATGPTPSADALTRPATAAPQTPSAPPAYGALPFNPQSPTAPYTYGQPAARPPAPAPAPYMLPTTYAPPAGHGTRRRRAVLIGCSYPGTSSALNGCLNDVQCIQFCLQKRFGFSAEQIVVLRDDPGRHPDFTSTKANIYRAVQWLMMDQRYGDSLFFHFSGHGSQQYDRNGDEEDGYDETICPSDFKRAGQIVDDELNRLMVRPLMPGVTLHAVVDACHSGTALDLPFRAKVDGAGRWYWKGRARYDKATAGGTAFQFGACKDSQVAQDTKLLSGNAYTGAATFCFIQAIEKYGINQTYGQILSHMMSTLRASTGSPGLNLGTTGSLIAGMLLGPAASAIFSSGGQTPVLSCDKQVDLYATKLSL